MHRRRVVLALVLLCVALTEPPKTRFLLPRANGLVLRSPGSEPIVSVQWYIARHPDNRAYVVSCRGACHWTAGPDSMDGEQHEAILPREPVKVALDGYGVAEFTLSVYAAGGKLREQATTTIRVCGDPDGEQPC